MFLDSPETADKVWLIAEFKNPISKNKKNTKVNFNDLEYFPIDLLPIVSP